MAKVSRLETKVEKCLEAGEYYEAHQIYRTLYYRFTGQEKYGELNKLLADGSENLKKAGELGSSLDLGELYADNLLKGALPPSEEQLNHLEKVFSLLPAHLPSDSEINSNSDRRNKFISTIIKWSQSAADSRSERKRGMSSVHYRIARVLYSEKDWEGARRHFLLADKPEEFATFLVDMHMTGGLASEADLFVATAAFQLMCLRRVRIASSLLHVYCSSHPKIKQSQPPYALPLINFVHLLLQAIPKKSLSTFSVLVEKYEPVITREQTFKGYVDKIGQLYFGVPPPRQGQPMGGLFGNLFKGLLGDSGNKEDSESEEECEAMEEDGYDTAPEEESSRAPLPVPKVPIRATVSKAATSKPARMEDMDDLD